MKPAQAKKRQSRGGASSKRLALARAYAVLLGSSATESAIHLLARFNHEAMQAYRRMRQSDGTADGDDESLHDFRVALRRARTVLRGYRSSFRELLEPTPRIGFAR
jgi:hypothetical protein